MKSAYPYAGRMTEEAMKHHLCRAMLDMAGELHSLSLLLDDNAVSYKVAARNLRRKARACRHVAELLSPLPN